MTLIANQLMVAQVIARKAHVNQFRRDGRTPYTTHLEGVVQRLSHESQDVIATGWLHDILEDTSVTVATLRGFGISEDIIEAVKTLTKHPEQSYDYYLEKIRKNEIARKVKVADMLHNLSDSPTEKQIVKYARGLLLLHAESLNDL